MRVSFRSLLFVLIVVSMGRTASAQLLSPGPLAAPHANLEGDESCGKCHTSGRGTSNALCNACHGNVTKQGMHARVFSGPCAKCHSDHRGRGFALERFDPKSFDHGQTGWPLGGKHGGTPCGKCHKAGSWQGVSRACTSCHEDPHKSRFGSACTGCHDESSWKQVDIKSFNHELARFPLKGAHRSAACSNCHGTPARYRGLDFGNCTSCHEDPHKGRFSGTCTSCHDETSWHHVVMKPGAHPGLSLANGHSRVGCARCHDRGQFAMPSRGRACVGCHKPVHEADLGTACHKCHAAIRWLGLPRSTGLAAHKKTAFQLQGKHEPVKCEACHSPSKPLAQRFRGLLFDKCNRCHADLHAGEFKSRSDGECGGCHTVGGFRPALFGVQAHASTRLPLVGHHTATPCASCHDKHPKSGPRLDWRGPSTRCESCHENPHGSQFERELERGGCAECHSPLGWHSPKIDHRSWPLTGAHASAPCARCHTPSDADRKSGRGASYRGTPRRCEGCHADAHFGQFRLARPVKSCTACHDTSGFRIRRFPHRDETGYALEGRHTELSCDKCHPSVTVKSGQSVRRYRLGYSRCKDCHADPHGEAER